MLNVANAREEDGAAYSDLEPLYRQALGLAEQAGNMRLKATTLNSLYVLQQTNGYLEKSSKRPPSQYLDSLRSMSKCRTYLTLFYLTQTNLT